MAKPTSSVLTKPKLTDAQRSFLRRLYLNGGHDRLFNSSFQTASALHEKGLIVVTIHDTHNGHVEITEAGNRIAKGVIDLLKSTAGRLDMAEFEKGNIVPLAQLQESDDE